MPSMTSAGPAAKHRLFDKQDKIQELHPWITSGIDRQFRCVHYIGDQRLVFPPAGKKNKRRCVALRFEVF
jgi:hypothetical protein